MVLFIFIVFYNGKTFMVPLKHSRIMAKTLATQDTPLTNTIKANEANQANTKISNIMKFFLEKRSTI